MRTTPRQVMDDIPPAIPAEPIRFLDQLRAFIRSQNKSWATEKTYILWIKRYIHFHQKKHPKDMGEIEIEKFLNHLVLQKHCSPSTQATALNALVYLYKQFLKREPLALTLLWPPHLSCRFEIICVLGTIASAQKRRIFIGSKITFTLSIGRITPSFLPSLL